ncbi:MAG TPA: glutamate--tRNA ligase [Thiobacillaceae bacterium]|nr:glutamate--tRNA ligase [Thiobacillaceae bacterium]
MIRTRFAPSPTGYLHIGGARTALFSWAYARAHGGQFVLRVEDTDRERSTEVSVQAILDGMQWLGLEYDEGPFFQMDRLARYKEMAEKLIAEGKAYSCYASKADLDAMRDAQKARGEKPRYDGRWRPEPGKQLPAPPDGVQPVIRFRNPTEGEVSFMDMIKGPITVSNSELDDLVILRADGIPTYNFGVVIDDWDMKITHVIRGDDHVNNTPRQINLLRALGAPLPHYAHVPMILGSDGERLSKRHGAVSVMQYHDEGYLPEALLNYLARLGWSHGDEELFSVDQFKSWFDLEHVSRSPAKFNPEKLGWLNQQYLKLADNRRLAGLVTPFLLRNGCDLSSGPELSRVVSLVKERAATVAELADAATLFYRYIRPTRERLAPHLIPAAIPALNALSRHLAVVEWNRASLSAVIKAVVAESGLKMPNLAMPLRVLVTGEPQTPAIDATLELLGRERVIQRLKTAMQDLGL